MGSVRVQGQMVVEVFHERAYLSQPLLAGVSAVVLAMPKPYYHFDSELERLPEVREKMHEGDVAGVDIVVDRVVLGPVTSDAHVVDKVVEVVKGTLA